ncbi:methionine gamma-lyase family protein [Guggenheimella bovis]
MMLNKFGISSTVVETVLDAEKSLEPRFKRLSFVRENNSLKILKAMQENMLSDQHFHWYTGYAYDDPGRAVLEKIYADVFGAEDALVRPQIASGTHALSLMLFGILRPGDRFVCISGTPYDTLLGIISGSEGSLSDYDIHYDEVPLKDGTFDREKIKEALEKPTKMVYIQRSQGYAFRPTVSIDALESIIEYVRTISPEVIVAVDNCYGEFTELKEPTEVGADISAGSLIKNPGGGLAPSGGYLVGRRDLIEKVSYKLTCPGLGKEIGGMFGFTRNLLQGLFYAPTVVENAVKSALLTAKVFEMEGYEVYPSSESERSDIIQAILLKDPKKVIAYCEAVQASSPVDSFVTPVPWAMPGYQDEVIMAAGTFIQGASIELSADAPMREPFVVYVQGSLLYEQGKLSVMKALEKIRAIG